MKPSFSLFWVFLKDLGKRWVLWLFLGLDVAAMLVQILLPSISLSRGVYLGIFVLGLILASFQTYLDLLSKVPGEARQLKPEVAIYFMEGSEYSFRIDPEDNALNPDRDELIKRMSKSEVIRHKLGRKLSLPTAIIDIRIRLENTGLVPVNVLAIGTEIRSLEVEPFGFMSPVVKHQNTAFVSFPTRIEAKQSLNVELEGSILPASYYTDAQFAARTRPLREKRVTATVQVFVEVSTPLGELAKSTVMHKVSLVPLCDLYISFWRETGKHDLISLATGEPLSD